MNTLLDRTWIIALFAALLLASADRASAQSTDWNVAALDQILAAVPPGAKTAQMGDMEILVSNLQAWRNQLAGGPAPQFVSSGTAPLWTGGNVFYSFSNNVSALKQQAFLDGAAEWAMFANLRFVARTTQANYITIFENAALNGGQSAVGMIGGQQFLQLGPSAWQRPVIVHELGHALGLVHEQQRTDRDSYVTVFTNNIQSGALGDFIKLANSQSLGAYDFLSVMHYNTNSFSLNPTTLPTILPLPAYAQFTPLIGAQFDPVLSAADRAGMAAKYGAAVPPVSPVVTNTADAGPGTLRGAIYYALDNPGTTITFNIPTSDAGFSNSVFNLRPTDGLPSLANSTLLDAGTQPTNSNPNGPEILLHGALAQQLGTYASGLKFTGTNCTARGLIINGFSSFSVLMSGPGAVSNTLAGCYLGVNASGTSAVTNGVVPLQIANGATFNTVGGPLATDRNVIAGSSFHGLIIRDAGTRNNMVRGNYIGVNAAGTAALPNTWAGIQIYNGAQSNHIGGPTSGSRNIISGNLLQGVSISGTNTTGNVVDGNYLGLNPAGLAAIPNSWAGVEIFGGATGNAVGSASPGVRNVISGNSLHGVSLSGAGTSANIVQGNYIGLNAPGTAVVPNNSVGVVIFNGAQANQVGTAGGGNVICGNGDQGVSIQGTGTKDNIIAGNYIGVAADGVTPFGNTSAGVAISAGAQSNLVGGTSIATRNLISGNQMQGVVIADANTRGNVVAGNYIGVNAAGTAALGNLWSGVNLFNGPDANRIGGTAPGAGNVISGNVSQGVLLQLPGTRDNSVQGNFIGLNAAGNAAVANGSSGVQINSGPTANLIGGGPNARNFISGNGNYGVAIDTGSAANLVQGNTIGLNATNGAAIPNTWAGVVLYNGAVSNQIGGVTPGAANLIAGSLEDGVRLFAATTTNNSVRGNSIFNSSGVGIALYNNANLSAVAPVLTSAVLTTNTTVTGTLNSTASTTFQIDFYSDAPLTGSAEGMTYLGSRSVTTSAGGTVGFTNSLGALVPAGRAITASATDPAGNTSRLSSGVPVTVTSSVNDTIPNAWRALYFGGTGATTNSQSCATCDPDGDGLTNGQEFLAGTNPTNSASGLKLVALPANGSGNVAEFLSSLGVVYRLETREDVAPGPWTLFADQVLGTGGNIILTDPNSALLPRRYYRAKVVW